MSDKARGALFSMLGDITGLTVLDAFAGSGALSFEAVSRGAAHVLAVESDKTAQRVIARNIRALDVGSCVQLVAATVNAWNATATPTMFDIVLCDPPYTDLQLNRITQLAADRVMVGGLLVLSWPGKAEVPVFPDFELAVQKVYGDIQLIFYRRLAHEM